MFHVEVKEVIRQKKTNACTGLLYDCLDY